MDRKIGAVYETTNYSQFKFLPGNRPVTKKGDAWKTLVRSMAEKGQMEPALVSPNMEVINGQHRLEAAKELEIPYRYMFGAQVCGAEDIAAANSSVKWKVIDYIRFYAEQTNGNAASYKLLQALLTEFPVSTTAFIGTIFPNGNQYMGSVVKTGKFTMSVETYSHIRKCYQDLSDKGFIAWAKEFKPNQRTYYQAVTYCWRHPQVAMDRLIHRLYQNQHIIPNTTRTTELLRIVSEIYNYRLSKANKVYLDTDFERGKYRDWEE